MGSISPGLKFGRLTVISKSHQDKAGNWNWLCRCDCGKTKTVGRSALSTGATSSCGCLKSELVTSNNHKHGYGKRGKWSKTYKIWLGVRKRCLDPASDYYAQGISFAARWEDFAAFLADMGECPSDEHSIDRYPNQNGNYEPGNCRWATSSQQARNRHSNVMVEHNGEVKCLADWTDELNLPYDLIYQRMWNGESFQDAMSRPYRERKKNGAQ